MPSPDKTPARRSRGRPPPYFVSYSRSDAAEFVDRLKGALARRSPPIDVFVDRDDLGPGPWRQQLSKAIQNGPAFLFVLTEDSVRENSVCQDEYDLARYHYKKDVIPLRLDPNVQLDLANGLQEVDFVGDFDAGVETLVRYLDLLGSPQAELRRVEGLIEDEKRRQRQASSGVERQRSGSELRRLREQRAALAALVEDPHASSLRQQAHADAAVSMVRRGPGSASGHAVTLVRPLPQVPVGFQDRDEETAQLAAFLKHGGQRLAVVFGRSGVGKTALACRVLRALQDGVLPSGEPHRVDAIVAVVAGAAGQTSASIGERLLDALSELLRAGDRKSLREVDGVAAKASRLLDALAGRQVVLLIDSVPLRPTRGRFAVADTTLLDALRALLTAPQHAVKVILTTTAPAWDLFAIEPARQMPLPLLRGLPSPFAERYLRSLDDAGDLGIAAATPALLQRALQLTGGRPKALQGLVAYLRANRMATLQQAVDDGDLLHNTVGEVFASLDADERKVMQILAVFPRPVPAGAVDFVVGRIGAVTDPQGALGRLFNLLLVTRDANGRMTLHDEDRLYARSTMALREARRGHALSGHAVAQAAAEFYRAARPAPAALTSYAMADPVLAEFELRIATKDGTAAAAALDVVGDQLILWGFAHELVDRCKALLPVVDGPSARMHALGRLGEALRAVGRSAEAIEPYAESLALAEAAGDLQAQAANLSYLARCHYNQGYCEEALDLCRRAFAVVASLAPGTERDRRIRYLSGVTGLCQLFTGDVAGAIGPLEAAAGAGPANERNALEADRHVGYLGLCYAYLGRHDEAVAHFKQALAMARSVGHRYGEAMHLVNLGEVLNARGQPERALALAREAVAIGDDIRSPRISGWGRWCIALALGQCGRFEEAHASLVGSTTLYSDPMNDDSLDVLLGVLCFRLQDRAAAADCFRRTLAGASTMLARNPRYFFSLDAAAVAWTGLALLGDTAARRRALDAFRRARAVTRAAGHVAHVARLLSWLVPAPRPRWYARVAAAAGL